MLPRLAVDQRNPGFTGLLNGDDSPGRHLDSQPADTNHSGHFKLVAAPRGAFVSKAEGWIRSDCVPNAAETHCSLCWFSTTDSSSSTAAQPAGTQLIVLQILYNV